ncbi:MAG: GFA family protein [Gaiellaceae bacterium]
MTGGCHCGAVRFEVTEPFMRVSVCHCTICKKISGGAGTISGRAATAAITLLEGAEHVRTYQPGDGSAKSFCVECGSNLFGAGWPKSESTSVRLSALDSFEGRPEAHIYVRSLAPWETLPDDGLPRYEASRDEG